MRSRRDVLRDNKAGVLARQAGAPALHASRRTFITASLAATGGLIVAMRSEAIAAEMLAPRSLGEGGTMPAQTGPLGFPTEYIQIDPDDGVLIWSAQPEMGEGTKTSLPMIVAEELDADWTRVRIDDTPMDPKYGGQGVGGSDAIRSDWDRLRRVGATARALLIGAAAAEWGVPAAECDTAMHVVRHRASNREARFGTLAARAATLTVPTRCAAERRIPLSADRHARERHRQSQGRHGPAAVRHRRPHARHEVRGDRQVPGVQRPADQDRCDQGPPGPRRPRHRRDQGPRQPDAVDAGCRGGRRLDVGGVQGTRCPRGAMG